MERWIHVDLKMQVQRCDALIGTITELAGGGATGFLLEWENSFPYHCVQAAVCNESYTAEEIGGVIGACANLGVLAVPLIQTIGHLEWLLSHPAFSHLREFPAEESQILACSHGSWETLGAMISEIIAAHRESPFIHLGGDEAWLLSSVDRTDCSAIREGPGAVYVRHLAPLIGQVKAAGKRPIIWADMALRHPEILNRLDRDVVMMDWEYFPINRYERGVKLWSGTAVHEKNIERLQGEDSLFVPFLGPSPLFPRYMDAFPFTKFLSSRGFDVMGATSVECAGDTMSIPNVPWHSRNVRTWNEVAEEENLGGVCCTAWSLRGHLREVNLELFHYYLDPRSDGGLPLHALLAPATPAHWANQTLPLRYDSECRRFRPQSVADKANQEMGKMVVYSDEHPMVQALKTQSAKARETREASAREKGRMEGGAWALGRSELELRNALWESSRLHSRGSKSINCSNYHREIDEWGNAVLAFMATRYKRLDVRLFETDRVETLHVAFQVLVDPAGVWY